MTTEHVPLRNLRLLQLSALTVILVLPLAAAKVIPVDLPPPESTPPTKKPVKVYIQSGQSNSLGFGAVKPGVPMYPNLFLSADPTLQPSVLPAVKSAIFKHGVYDSIAAVHLGTYDPATDYPKSKPALEQPIALGSTYAKLPSVDGPHFVIITALVDVPYDGNYELHAGFGPESRCFAELDGREVYRKEPGISPKYERVTLQAGRKYPLRIIHLAGNSAALWLKQVDIKAIGDLGWVVNEAGRFRYLLAEDGTWLKRPDVFLNDAYMGKGSSAPHGVDACGPTFGPELGFGFVMGTFHDEPVIVMKADIGNRSLGWDILPPGSERYTHEGREQPGYMEMLDADGKVIPWDGKGWYAGKQYDDYTAAIRAVLDHFGERYPQFKDQGYEVAGFVWWQGHKDGPNPAHNARYEQNLVNLIKAWRKEFNAPEAPWVIATVGFQGENMAEHYVKIAEAQLNVADPKRHPELAGTVKTIETRPFWRDASISPKDQDYHYNHNAETYMLVGDALGRAMAELKGAKVEYPKAGLVKPVSAPPKLKEATDEQLHVMVPAIKPIIMDGILPDFAREAASVPAYLRKGQPLDDMLAGRAPAKPTPVLTSQMDLMIRLYNHCGIHDYDWKPFGPEMRTAPWHYLTFDPAEKKTDYQGDRYREVTLPAGSENWFAVDFDPAKAGWKTANAPFGQKDGQQVALSSLCKVPHCGCDLKPATLWDKEVILMRQSFEVPKLDPDHRYRIVVGGAGHPWSGEGFALYLNGKRVSEATGGYYKNGGDARGVIITKDLLPEFGSGRITVAAKSFLRRNAFRDKPAPPSGHMSVWLESARLSPVAAELAAKLQP